MPVSISENSPFIIIIWTCKITLVLVIAFLRVDIQTPARITCKLLVPHIIGYNAFIIIEAYA